MVTILIPIISMLPSSRAPPKHVYSLIHGLKSVDVEVKLLVGSLEDNLIFPNNCKVKKVLKTDISLRAFFYNIFRIKQNLDSVDLIYVPTSTPVLIITFLANVLKGKPIIAGPNMHGFFLEEIGVHTERSFPPKIRRRIPVFGKKMYEMNILCDHFVSFTEQQKILMIKRGLHSDKISPIHHSVDTEKYSPTKRDEKFWTNFNINSEIIILFTGRLTEEKGILELLEVFELFGTKNSNISLVICGGGGNLEGFVSEKTKEMKNAHYIGFLAESDLQKAYASADIGIFPSPNEGFGLVYLESMASGLPTVGVNNGGPGEIITNAFDGILLQDNSPTTIWNALDKLIKDKELRKELGKNARLTIEKKYAPEVIAKEYLNLFRRFLN
jgi:glycosyltransferase involved in cell wall biosynthesis